MADLKIVKYKPPIVLTDWAVGTRLSDGAYTAPELLNPKLIGVVKTPGGKFSVGDRIITSSIIRAEGRDVYTASGSHYRLEGQPEPKFLEWLKANGHAYDPEHPILVVG